MKITDMRVSGRAERLGLDEVSEFSWKVVDGRPGVRFDSAQVRVGDAAGDEVWLSDETPTPGILALAYGGPALSPRTSYTWAVRIRDEAGELSEWSDPLSFETGLQGEGLTDASWIRLDEQPEVGETGQVQYLRTEFTLPSAVRRARAYSTALGWYRLHVNGVDVTGAGMYPGFTDFDSRVEYQVRDVTASLTEGVNALGLVVADGRFRGRIGAMSTPSMYGNTTAAIARIEIELVDGTTVTVVTDEGWTGGHGEIVTADPRSGEVIDARLRAAWSTPGYRFAEPVPVRAVEEHRRLVASSAPAMEYMTSIPAVSRVRSPSGRLIVDFGQNIHGVVRIVARGESGTAITVEHSEVLTRDGEVDLVYLFGGLPFESRLGPDTLLLSGEADEFVPTFCTQGFRYASIDAPEGVELIELAAIPIHAALDYHGRFSCSDELVTRFHENVRWSMRGNFLDVPTDCPTRERSGWTGDAQVFAPTALMMADVDRYLTNWLADMRSQQHADGTITDIVPLDSPNWREGAEPLEMAPGVALPPSGSAGWGDAIVLIPWSLYQRTGSTVALEQNYDAMVAWVERYARMAAATSTGEGDDRYLVDSGYHWGEWLEPAGEGDGTEEVGALIADLTAHPRSWVATAYFEHSSRILAEVARTLGRPADAERFAGYAEGALRAWRGAYMRDATLLEPDAQASYVRALEFSLVPDERRAATAARLVERIRERGQHLGTGFLSTAFLLRQLSANGYDDVALDLVLQQTPPSWLGQVLRGATTIWETWTGYDEAGDAALSHNHYSLGASALWLYENLAGLRSETPGWRRFRVDPYVNGRITQVAAATTTPFGEASIDWTLDGHTVKADIEVPAGAEATVVFRGGTAEDARLDEVDLAATGLELAYLDGSPSVLVGSGRHRLSWEVRSVGR